ncbi:pentatricopeptide repeat-containing protein At2g30780 [Silene latifolia]|uniref:pentatricopeptide repeat-containing protein At2g30780 n=1 Tax=Silene latifolia TaxID=37657 RepID=UPI003D772FC5
MRTQWRHLFRYRPHLKPTSKISSLHQIHHRFYSSTTNSTIVSSNPSVSCPQSMNFLIGLFSDPSSKASKDAKSELSHHVSILKNELLKHHDDPRKVHKLLRDLGLPLFSSYIDGSAFIELLKQIYKFPVLAVEVFNWRRKHADFTFPISPEEYAKGIRVAGQAKNMDFAIELFTEAINNGCKTSVTYNALMASLMINGFADKCQVIFQEFKKDQSCSPNIVTYNILISVFGRLMLINHMESTLQEIYNSRLIPNVYTFNNLITGYVTAWMWDRMENTYLIMKQQDVEPDIGTYKLMVRGYAHAGNLKKMEEMYELLKQHSGEDNIQLIKAMICAYCKSSCVKKIEKINSLLKLIPEEEYGSWLIVSLIRVYARENLLDKMEEIINVAFEKKVAVTSIDVMRKIISVYYHHNNVEKLSSFVKRAESAEWILCRSLYHCKMVMYSSERRLEEMESVLVEMEKFGINSRTKKSLVILCVAYSRWGPKCKLEQLVALMLKLGYDIHWEKMPLLREM